MKVNVIMDLTFRQIFDLYCDINLIDGSNFGPLVEHILSQKYDRVTTFHRYGFLFYYFHEFVRGFISREQFLTMGDVEGLVDDQINVHRYREQHPCFLDSLTSEYLSSLSGDDLLVVDQRLIDYYCAQHGKLSTSATVVPCL